MEKLSKCKHLIKEFGVSVLTGTTILLVLFATSVQAFLMLLLLGLGLGAVLFLLWRII